MARISKTVPSLQTISRRRKKSSISMNTFKLDCQRSQLEHGPQRHVIEDSLVSSSYLHESDFYLSNFTFSTFQSIRVHRAVNPLPNILQARHLFRNILTLSQKKLTLQHMLESESIEDHLLSLAAAWYKWGECSAAFDNRHSHRTQAGASCLTTAAMLAEPVAEYRTSINFRRKR